MRDGDLMGDGVNIAARLEEICQPGAICLSEDAYRQVKGRLDLVVIDLGPRELKNIAEPIRVYSLEVGAPAHPKPARAAATEKPGAPRLSIVVLPFANIGGGAEHEPFVDGVTESLTTDLSRIRGSFVIGRNTAFTYKGKPVDLKRIGRELNVRYVLEGSVQRGGNRMRVNAQFIDAETGDHLWAERFDKPLADLFDMQDEIVARLAGALNAQLVAAEARRAEQAPTPNSMDLYFQGSAWLNKGTTADNVAQARSFFDRALIADPDNVDALVGSARAQTLEGGLLLVGDPMTALALAEAKLTKALSSVPDHARAHLYLGYVDILTKRAAEGIAECEHALTLDRNLAEAHSFVGLGKFFVGRAEETEAIAEAPRLSPRDTLAYRWMAIAGIAENLLGSWEQAVAWFRRSIEANRNIYAIAYFHLAAALANIGRLVEAHSAVRAGLALNPAFPVSRAQAAWTAMSDDPTFLPSFSPFLKACARPACRRGDRAVRGVSAARRHCWCLRQALARERAVDGRALGHPHAVIEHAREGGGVDAIDLHPTGDGEEIGVGDRIGLAHHPGPAEHLLLNQVEARADGLRNLLLHCFDRRRVVRPSIAARAMSVRDMHRRAQIAHERLHFREGERIVERSKASGRMSLGDIGENGRRFRQDAAIGDERRHPALRVDPQIVGLGLLGRGEVDEARVIRGARLLERDMRSERAGVGRVVEREHGNPGLGRERRLLARLYGHDPAAPFKLGDDPVGERLRRLGGGIQDEFRRLRRFIRLVDAGEVLDLASQRPLVQALGIARDDRLERSLDENLEEFAPRPRCRGPAAARPGTAK